MLVSVVTPTYNRRHFIPALIECFKSQDYPMDCIEWIILDDGTDKVGDLFEKSCLPNIRYYEDIKHTIGYKRNKLNQYAKGEVIVCMDDDDYYPSDRISHAVELLSNSKFSICGSSELYLFYNDDNTIYKLGPYGPNHATNGTLAYKRSYLENHKHDESVKHGEESSFLNNYSEHMIQLNPFKTQLLMSHSENTFDKKKIRDSPMVKLTQFKLNDFVKNEKLREFYSNA